jgi:hypothetical protein
MTNTYVRGPHWATIRPRRRPGSEPPQPAPKFRHEVTVDFTSTGVKVAGNSKGVIAAAVSAATRAAAATKVSSIYMALRYND